MDQAQQQPHAPAPLPPVETIPADRMIDRLSDTVSRLIVENTQLSIRLEIRTARVTELEQQLAGRREARPDAAG